MGLPVIAALAACGGADELQALEGTVAVSINQNLSLSAVDYIVLEIDGLRQNNEPWSYSTHFVKNDRTWTTTIGGVPFGTYTIRARAMDDNGTVALSDDEELFSAELVGEAIAGSHTAINLILQDANNGGNNDFNSAPLFHSVVANKAAVNPGGVVEIKACAFNDAGEAFYLSGEVGDSFADNGEFAAPNSFEMLGNDGATQPGCAKLHWTAGDEGTHTLQLVATDAAQNVTRLPLSLVVGTGLTELDAHFVLNLSPTVESLKAETQPRMVDEHPVIALSFQAYDPDFTGNGFRDYSYLWSIVPGSDCEGTFTPATETAFTGNGRRRNATTEFTVTGGTNGGHVGGETLCSLQVVVTDEYFATTSATIRIDPETLEPIYVPNLVLSMQSHDSVGYGDVLAFEVYADGIPNTVEAEHLIDFDWYIGDNRIWEVGTPFEVNEVYLEANVASWGWSYNPGLNRAETRLEWTPFVGWVSGVRCEGSKAAPWIKVIARATSAGVSDEIEFRVDVKRNDAGGFLTGICRNWNSLPNN